MNEKGTKGDGWKEREEKNERDKGKGGRRNIYHPPPLSFSQLLSSSFSVSVLTFSCGPIKIYLLTLITFSFPTFSSYSGFSLSFAPKSLVHLHLFSPTSLLSFFVQSTLLQQPLISYSCLSLTQIHFSHHSEIKTSSANCRPLNLPKSAKNHAT